MRIEQLRCFLEVAKIGSITGAAQNLYISQQSASKSIKLLEQELGCELLTRGKNGVGVTSYGKEVAETAKRILDEQETLQEKLNTMKAEKLSAQEIVFRIMSTSPIINSTLPRIIADLDAKSAKIDLKLSTSDTMDEVIDCVKDNRCDVGFVTFNEQETLKKYKSMHQEMVLDILSRDEIVAVIDERYYNGHNEYLTVANRQQYRISQYNIIPVHEYMEYIGVNGSVMQSNDADFHRQMLEIGAMSIMPKLAYEYFFKKKRFIALQMEDVDIPFVHAAIYRKDSNIYLKEFVALIRKEMHVK